MEANVADIGTDHGFLPVYLAQTGIARRIVASDISSGSLASAKRSAEKYGVTGKIEFLHAPGLDGISVPSSEVMTPGEDNHLSRPDTAIDTVVIAGVGGETIADILTDASWTAGAASGGKLKLILQPQTKLEKLREYLRKGGYALKDEKTVLDRGRTYTILII